MLKKYYILWFVISCINLYSNDFFIENTAGEVSIEYNSTDQQYTYKSYLDEKIVFYDSEIIYKDNGFGYLKSKIKNKMNTSIVITGRNNFLLYNSEVKGLSFMVFPQYDLYTEYFTYTNRKNKEAHSSPYFNKDFYTDQKIRVYTFGIKEVISSTSLKEELHGQTIEYSAMSLNNRYISNFITLYWNSELPPWVEGVDGYGIGEWLEVAYEEPTDNIVILNGYVDFLKTNLYKDNSRVKKFKIISEDDGDPFEIEITLEDIVKFQYFELPRKAKKVKLEIVEVYEGRKWADTAVTGIFSLVK
ncbi:MAG: hypothetical protein JXR64_13815 [Spirochaetales bacterium]|nr:hypothetical protein [Spirochaetales bacterium]